MAKKKKKARAEPEKRSVAFCTEKNFESLVCSGYTSLAKSPEVSAGVDRIAELIGAMTIHLMENGVNGDVRIRNELSRKMDISHIRTAQDLSS